MTGSVSGQASQRPQMVDVRCKACGRLICRTDASCGKIEVVCPDKRCKRYQTVNLSKG
jgi:phage FluMu protein Com